MTAGQLDLFATTPGPAPAEEPTVTVWLPGKADGFLEGTQLAQGGFTAECAYSTDPDLQAGAIRATAAYEARTDRKAGKGWQLGLDLDPVSARVIWSYLDHNALAVEEGWGDTDDEARSEARACRKGCERIAAAFPGVEFRR